MAWSYSGDPSSSARSAIRFLVGDTDIDDQVVSDEEIDWVNLETSGSITSTTALYRAAARVTLSIAAKWSRQADQTTGDFSVKLSQKAEAARTLAEDLNRLASADLGVPVPFAGGISESDKDNRRDDLDRVEPWFVTSQFSNTTDPGAGPARSNRNDQRTGSDYR